MILATRYDAKTGVDETWYESSTIVYTKFVENKGNNMGQLYVTFKGGATYLYRDVDMPTNYLQFKHEMKDSSSGKSLNAYIKPHYQCEKVDPLDIQELITMKEETIKAQDISHTYFISGHRDITPEEFDLYYASSIDAVLMDDPNAKFIVGDYYGVDIMAQDYLVTALHGETDRVTVYHMLESPRNLNPAITNLKGGYESDDERDSAMTRESSFDIAFVRPGKLTSGTAQNLARRHLMQ